MVNRRRAPAKSTLRTCRICGAATSPANPAYPFCGEQCRERDLGNWATESYRVAAAVTDEDDLADSAAAARGGNQTDEE